jgi:cell filamentation protein
MTNSYKYIDPEYVYTDPKTGILRNKENIENYPLLIAFESLKVSRRLEELQKNPIKIKNSETLLISHTHLFQDVYAWAGEIRTVEISKGGTPFFPVKRFDVAFTFINTLLAESKA